MLLRIRLARFGKKVCEVVRNRAEVLLSGRLETAAAGEDSLDRLAWTHLTLAAPSAEPALLQAGRGAAACPS